MERRFKGLVAINDVLDDRYQKLSDDYHDLKLSHNRKKKTLEMCLRFCEVVKHTHPDFYFGELCYPVLAGLMDSMQRAIESALWSDGRERKAPKKKKKITMATVKARKK